MTLKSRANFLLDIELMFNAGKHTIGGSRLHFVTSDKAMIASASRAGSHLSVWDFNEYMDFLGLRKYDPTL